MEPPLAQEVVESREMQVYPKNKASKKKSAEISKWLIRLIMGFN